MTSSPTGGRFLLLAGAIAAAVAGLLVATDAWHDAATDRAYVAAAARAVTEEARPKPAELWMPSGAARPSAFLMGRNPP